MKRSYLLLIAALGFIIGSCAPKENAVPIDKSVPTAPISVPADLAAHDWAQTEWWYYTGHLQAADGRTFGFEVTFFRGMVDHSADSPMARIPIDAGYMGHFAVVDETTGKYQPVVRFKAQGKKAEASTTQYDIKLDQWTAGGDDKVQHIHAEDRSQALTLEVKPAKPVVFHGHDGVVMKGPDIGNYYFSYTRLQADGMLRIGDEEIPVTGEAWFDHEFGYMGFAPVDGWAWYSIQLDNNTEYMIYAIRGEDGKIREASKACRIDENSVEECIPYTEIKVEVLGRWLSPHTGGLYPASWKITMDKWGEELVIVPTVADQEFSEGPIAYWEGSCKVLGTHGGRSYIELVGYAKPRHPPKR